MYNIAYIKTVFLGGGAGQIKKIIHQAIKLSLFKFYVDGRVPLT
jgi:hypothetical protein